MHTATRRAMKMNEKGETRLHIAARMNKTCDVVTLILEGADINAQDYAGSHILHLLLHLWVVAALTFYCLEHKIQQLAECRTRDSV